MPRSRPGGRSTPPAAWFYPPLAVVGLVGTWYFTVSFSLAASGESYVGAWFANAASSSIAVDIIVVGVAVSVFFVREGRRLLWARWRIAVLVVATFAVAAAFTVPLFFALRERQLARASGVV